MSPGEEKKLVAMLGIEPWTLACQTSGLARSAMGDGGET